MKRRLRLVVDNRALNNPKRRVAFCRLPRGPQPVAFDQIGNRPARSAPRIQCLGKFISWRTR
jgi:hypothetical protein